jgi:hypothetical protein
MHIMSEELLVPAAALIIGVLLGNGIQIVKEYLNRGAEAQEWRRRQVFEVRLQALIEAGGWNNKVVEWIVMWFVDSEETNMKSFVGVLNTGAECRSWLRDNNTFLDENVYMQFDNQLKLLTDITSSKQVDDVGELLEEDEYHKLIEAYHAIADALKVARDRMIEGE